MKKKTKKGKFIVVDGTDGSGKATQTGLLVSRLRKNGKKVKTIDFPRYYNNFFGKLVGECLAGEHGDFAKFDPYIASVLYAADRWESGEKINKWLKNGFWVVADRYASSNQIHQGGKISNRKKRSDFLKWLEKMEFSIFGIPKPDKIIYLDVPLEVSQRLMAGEDKRKKKNYLRGKKDVHENNPGHLKNAKKNAIKLVREYNNWSTIKCTKKDKLMSKEGIADLIWAKLNF